ncbi:hypothetical protein BDV95DRAFT_601725 [Massariosphaeria phaeospora]|uniref:SH3 domain-containing protein n=1 Tax=Massariosphaeria phaeospora TaxID=100035 RepID=A0A7C8MIP2_9PLEO|nr:hypothetical protein BDV95DRAFT_601725 [Massariosphaeria phaeospora]
MPHFKVKAIYDYASPHDDDLKFPAGQIITVTEEEDADWYVGEYVDDSGTKHDGLFPRNFVDKYEPAPPPRPNRASRYKPLEQPADAVVAPPTPLIPLPEPAPFEHEELQTPKPQAAPVELAPPQLPPTSPIAVESPRSPEPVRSSEVVQDPVPAPKPVAAAPAAKKAPPPVAAKSSSFLDRIAAFNAPTAAPIQPFKPSGGPPASFIKKPFVAPPPSRNAYVPPPREAPQVKTYRRDEDPEIAERRAQEQENAEKAGLVGRGAPTSNDAEEEDQPKPTSLKERIALLQKQQAEQAERAAATSHKEKPKKPPMRKRTESHDGRDPVADGGALEQVASGESKARASIEHGRPPRSAHGMKSPDVSSAPREFLSDANDADQSGAGDTEDAEGTSTSVEEDEDRAKSRQVPPPRAAAAPLNEPDVGDEDGAVDEVEEEEEENEMDAEARRKLELRERMAKMSGGMGMAGMFGGGLPMGQLPPKKKKSVPEKRSTGDSEEHAVPQQRVAMFPMPGMPVKSPESEDRQLAVEKEDSTSHPITEAHAADEVPDMEDLPSQSVPRTPTAEHPPPIPADSKFLISRKPVNRLVRENLHCFQLSTSETVSKTYVAFDGVSEYVMTVSVSKRPAPPRMPTDRPVPPPVLSASRPMLPQVRSPSPGSESGDEMTDAPAPHSATSPRTPSAFPLSKRSSYLASDELSQDSPDRRVPPIPIGSPTMSPVTSRPPPPPPPPGVPPSRQGTMERMSKKLDREGETDYEGDYDTDIASGATHKDALKAHVRELSVDANTLAGEATSSVRSPTTSSGLPPLPPTVPRAVPPPPPQQPPSRMSLDAPRGAPPPPPIPPPSRDVRKDDVDEDDEEYDPYRYVGPPRAVPLAPKGMPPPPQSQPPPPQNRSLPPLVPPVPPGMPPMPQQQAAESSDEDELYSAPPRKSHDRPPPPPPQAPPHQQRPPPPPQERVAPLPPPAEPPRAPVGRKSLDVNRVVQGRASMDQSRPSASQDFIATDVDLGASSHWWTQPNMPPPALQKRKDVLLHLDEERSGNFVEKTVYVLHMDYSQTVVTARFDASNVSDVELEQRQEPPPARLRQDQLENAHEEYGRRIAKDVEGKQNTVVGDGTPHGLILELLRPYSGALHPVSTRSFGALVYANLANASTQQYDEIRPGDVISFRNAKFQGKHGSLHAKYAVDVGKPDHVGVVVEWDGSKKKVRVWEQGRESKKVKPESFRMGDLRSGEVRVWRVMGRAWVGWN